MNPIIYVTDMRVAVPLTRLTWSKLDTACEADICPGVMYKTPKYIVIREKKFQNEDFIYEVGEDYIYVGQQGFACTGENQVRVHLQEHFPYIYSDIYGRYRLGSVIGIYRNFFLVHPYYGEADEKRLEFVLHLKDGRSVSKTRRIWVDFERCRTELRKLDKHGVWWTQDASLVILYLFGLKYVFDLGHEQLRVYGGSALLGMFVMGVEMWGSEWFQAWLLTRAEPDLAEMKQYVLEKFERVAVHDAKVVIEQNGLTEFERVCWCGGQLFTYFFEASGIYVRAVKKTALKRFERVQELKEFVASNIGGIMVI